MGSCGPVTVAYGSNEVTFQSMRYGTVDVPAHSNITIFTNLNAGCTVMQWSETGSASSVATHQTSLLMTDIQSETTIMVLAIANVNAT